MCETIPSLVEVEAFVELLNEHPAAHAMLAVACRSESELNDGSPIARVAAALAQLKNPSQLLAGARSLSSLFRLAACWLVGSH